MFGLQGFFLFMDFTKECLSGLMYNKLFSLGGDNLVSFYSILRNKRKHLVNGTHFYAYKNRNGVLVAGKSLLRKRTGFSVKTIEKYSPMLVELGFMRFTPQGHVILDGVNKINTELYSERDSKKTKKSNIKYIPIKATTFTKTKTSSYFVRISSLEDNQIKTCKAKKDRKEKVFKLENDKVSSTKELMSCKKTKKYVQENPNSIKGILENTVLSLQGFASYKDNSKDNKSKGSYYKRKLVNEGYISTQRRYVDVDELSHLKVTLRTPRSYVNKAIRIYIKQTGVKGIFLNGVENKVQRELVSSFSCNVLSNSLR